METKQEKWPLPTFKLTEKQINPQPTYQRSSVWKTSQKQMLIDSVIRGIDIPKIYLRQLKNNPTFKYEIIDGQQRMRTIWEFMDDKFALSAETSDVAIDSKIVELSEKKYSEIPAEVNIDRIQKYSLDVIIIKEATEDEIADLFYRLNNGTPLSPAEVRNSMPGIVVDTVRRISMHKFFTKVNFSNQRFAHNQVCAMMLLLELKGITDLRDRELTKMYSDYSKYIPTSAVDNLETTLKTLDKVFQTKSKMLNRVPTINIYILISYLHKTHKITDSFFNEFYDWYLETEPKRLKDPEYKLYMMSSANSINSIENRMRIIIYQFYERFTQFSIIKLDPHRIFSDTQKINLYSKYKGICQKCLKNVSETNWHADHIMPWIKGGKTEEINGQVLCIKCNLSKKDRLWT